MNIKSRLLKLEKSINRNVSILVMYKPVDGWTPEQLRQMDKAVAQNKKVLISTDC